MDTRVLVTGGSGTLGSEFRKVLPEFIYPSHNEFDITDFISMDSYLSERKVDVILHAAAFTSPPRIDENPLLALETNIMGTANIVKVCEKYKIKLIYISTDYVFKGSKGNYKENDSVYPVNKYAWSKLGGECAVRLYDNSLIIRTSFSENVFPYEKAFIDQWTSRITVSELIEKLKKIIPSNYTGTLHVGSERKTVFDYAKKISPYKKIGELSLNEVTFNAPRDTSLSIIKYLELFD